MGTNAFGRHPRQLLAGAAVALVGAALLAVPLYDVWDDTTDLGWQLTPTVVENALLVGLASVLVAGGVWLARTDWNADDATTVATATVVGTLLTGALFGWILAIQEATMGALKPYIIALDAVVVGAVGSFGVGVYRARSNRRRRELQTQRDRLSGLYENTSDAVATVEIGDDGSRFVSSTNDRFDAVFDDVADIVRAGVPDGTSAAIYFRDLDTQATQTTELRRDTAHGEREFHVQYVPYDTARGRTYVAVVATDITEQQELAREREANEQLELLHEFTSRLANTDSADDAYELVVDAVEELFGPPGVRVVDDDEVVAVRGEVAADDGGPSDVSSVSVGDRGRIDVAGDLTEREAKTVELLATHLDGTLMRLERERELADEREELNFINRTLRHNLLNDIQVVKARLETLEAQGETLDEHRDVLVDPLDRMAEFVQTMRSYTKARIEEDEQVLHPVDLEPTLTAVAANTRESYEHADVTVGDIPDVEVQADELLDPVFDNILKNAVEHNDKEPARVHVDADLYGDWVTVRVADNGPGIPDDRKGAVFERGELGEHSSGSGFGLFLVEKTVESYGGGVELLDNEPTGTVVRVTLPVASD